MVVCLLGFLSMGANLLRFNAVIQISLDEWLFTIMQSHLSLLQLNDVSGL